MKKSNLDFEQFEHFRNVVEGEWDFSPEWLKAKGMIVAILPLRYSQVDLNHIFNVLKIGGSTGGYSIETCYLDKEFDNSDPGSCFEFDFNQVDINTICSDGPELDHIIISKNEELVVLCTLEEYWMIASSKKLIEMTLGKSLELVMADFDSYVTNNQWQESEQEYFNKLINKYKMFNQGQ